MVGEDLSADRQARNHGLEYKVDGCGATQTADKELKKGRHLGITPERDIRPVHRIGGDLVIF